MKRVDIEKIIKKVIDDNPNMLDQYKNGNTKVFNVFIGLIMKESKGLVSPSLITNNLKEILDK